MAYDEGVNRQFGVVLFDSPEDPGPGWYSIGGTGKDPRPARISGPHELSTGVIWWTNIPYGHFFRGVSEIWRNPWLRHDKYLVVSPADVLKEWGHDPKFVGADFIAVFVAEAFHRIMHIAYNLVRQTDPKLRMDLFFEGKTLRDDLRRLVPDAEYPKGEAAMMMRSGQAYEEFTRASVRMPKGAKFIRLRVPRLTYCWELLQAPFPLGPWEYISRGDMSSNLQARLDYALEKRVPKMVEVTLSQMQQEVAPIYGFGNATDKNKNVQRTWVAHPELAMLARFAKIEVRNCWQGREYSALVPQLPEALKEFLTDKFTDVSWSAGVVAETLWRAAALPEEKGKAGTRDSGERADTSWRGAWIKAADKSSMFLKALRLSELGHSISSYGLGWGFCGVAEEGVPNLIKDGSSMGLLPALVDVPDGMAPQGRMLQWGGDLKSSLVAHKTHAKQKNFLWNLDKLPLMPKEHRKEMLEKLMQADARKRI
jgi:hypothetical protein